MVYVLRRVYGIQQLTQSTPVYNASGKEIRKDPYPTLYRSEVYIRVFIPRSTVGPRDGQPQPPARVELYRSAESVTSRRSPSA